MRIFPTRAARVTLLAASLFVAAAGCNSRSDRNHPRTVAHASSPAATTQGNASSWTVSVDDHATLSFLASDALEGRGIGTIGLERAAGFIAGQFTQLGVKPPAGQQDFFQPFEVTTATEVGPETKLLAGTREFGPGKDFAPVAQSGEGEFAGKVVFAGYGETSAEHKYDDYAGLDVKGKIVLAMRFDPHKPDGKSRFVDDGGWSDAAPVNEKARRAREHGAVAILLATPPKFHEDDDHFLPLGAASLKSSAKSIPLIQIKRTVRTNC